MSVKIVVLIFLIFSGSTYSQSFKNLLDSDFIDLELGGGYVAGTSFREEFDGDKSDNYQGLAPLYLLKISFFYFGNVPNLIDLDAKGFQFGTVSFFGGDSYEVDGVDKDQHFFAGGFIGYGPLTFFAISDVTSTSSGTTYTLRYSPLLYKGGKSTLHLVAKAELMNENYVNYFFGIDQTEVTNSPHFSTTYSPKTTENYEAQFIYNQKVSKNSRFTVWLGGSIMDQRLQILLL